MNLLQCRKLVIFIKPNFMILPLKNFLSMDER